MAYTLPGRTDNLFQDLLRAKEGYVTENIPKQNMSIPTQNMSYSKLPAKKVAPVPTPLGLQQKIGIPGVGSTPITPYAPSVGFSAERAKIINAPVKDTNAILKTDKADPHVQQLQQHFDFLKQKGRLELNQKQSEYIKRYKTKFPDYANVPDVNLYAKIIQKHPEAMDKYGNIGDKGFLQNLVETPFNIAKSGAETVQRYADRYSEDVAKGGGGAFDTLAAIGGVAGGVAMDVLGNTVNTVSPLMNSKNSQYATTFTEGLSQDVSQAIPETVKTTVADLATKYPTVAEYVEKGLDISNLIPFLGVLGKAKGAGQVDDIMRQVKARPATKFRGAVSQDVFDAGQSKGVLGGLSTAGKNTKKALTPDFISKDAPTLKAEKIRQGFETQNTNLKSVGNAHKKNTKTYTLDDGTKETVTPIDTLEKYDIAPEVTDKTIKMGDYKATQEGALGKIQDNIEQIGVDIDTKLVNSGKKVSLAEMKAKAEAAIKSDPDLRASGKVASTLKKLDDRFEDYANSYGDELDVMEINNIRKVANKDWSPDTTDVSQIVGDVSRDIVYNSTDDIAVRNLLREQGNLLAARKYAEAINGTRVVGGRLGQAIWRGIGTTIGASLAPVLGPLAPFGGLAVGEAIGKISAASQFKSLGGELKGLFSKTKNGGAGLPKPKVKPQVKASIVSRVPKAEANQMSSGSLPSSTKSVSNEQKLLPMPKLPQVESGKSISPSQLPKEKSISAGKKVNNSIIEKLAKKQETPKTDYLNTTEAKMTDAELKSLAKKYLETSKLPVGKGRVNSDNMADYKGYARIRDYFKSQGDDSLLESKLPKTPQEGKTAIGKYKSSEILPTDNPEFSQRFIPESKIDETTTKMATIQILDKNGKVVEKFSFSRSPYSEKQIQDMADVLIRERVIGRALNSKDFDVKMKGLKNLPVNQPAKPKPSLPLSQKSEVKYSKPDTLVQEAKKYKSAEEFVKAQGEPVYHGTAKDFTEFKMSESGTRSYEDWGRGIYLTPSEESAGMYARESAQRSDSALQEMYKKLQDIPSSLPGKNQYGMPNPNPTYDKALKAYQDAASSSYKTNKGGKTMQVYIDEGAKRGTHVVSQGGAVNPTIADKYREKGFDIVDIKAPNGEIQEIVVLNPDVIKTRQQLLDIYNKANKK